MSSNFQNLLLQFVFPTFTNCTALHLRLKALRIIVAYAAIHSVQCVAECAFPIDTTSNCPGLPGGSVLISSDGLCAFTLPGVFFSNWPLAPTGPLTLCECSFHDSREPYLPLIWLITDPHPRHPPDSLPTLGKLYRSTYYVLSLMLDTTREEIMFYLSFY